MDVIRENRLIASILGGLVVMVVLVLLLSGGDSEPASEVANRPSATATATAEAAAPDADRPDVAPLNCARFITIEEGGNALGVWDRPSGQQNSIRFTRGETCIDKLDVDDRVFVQIGPGAPADFEAGAELLGVRGEPVLDVGDGALWFGGIEAEGGGDQGVLSVRQAASVGVVHFRITLGRPELDRAEQLEVAKQVALDALPRFPGVELTPPEPVVVTIEREPVDRSQVSLEDYLLAREEAGEWTRGEGLVAALAVFAGEVDPAEALGDGELLISEGTGVLAMASEYLANGDDAGAKLEIERLLDTLLFSNARLEAMPGIDTVVAQRLQPVALSTASQEEDCIRFFPGYENRQADLGVIACLEHKSTTIDGKQYRVFFPAPFVFAGETIPWGWSVQDYDLAFEALVESVHTYNALEPGTMPAVNLVFSMGASATVAAYAKAFTPADEPCGVLVWVDAKSLADGSPKFFQQVIAHEVAHCFQTELFAAQSQAPYSSIRWWDESLAEYLSNVVYPRTQFEWRSIGPLETAELSTTPFDRSYENFYFWQHLHWFLGDLGIFGMIDSLPASGGIGAQRSALAANPGIAEDFHTYVEWGTDGDVGDSGGGPVPYTAESDAVQLSGPTVIRETPAQFGLVRLDLVVAPGQYACMEYETNGDLIASWRAGGPQGSGGWSRDLPDTLQGEAMFVASSTGSGASFTVRAVDVDDEPDCEDDEDGGPVEVPTPCPLECDPSEYYWRGFGVDPE